MKQGIMAAAIASALVLPSAVSAQTPPSAPCTPSGGLSFVCGVQNGEDLVAVPNTRWLIASGMAPGSGLRAVDTQAKALRTLYAAGKKDDAIKALGQLIDLYPASVWAQNARQIMDRNK